MTDQTVQQQVQPQMVYQQPAATPVYQQAVQPVYPAAPTTSILGLDVQDSQFWKGALLGAAVALLVTNESVQKGVVKTVSKLSGKALEQVEKAYQTAKHLFEQGNLRDAISKWEEVERMAPGYKSVRDYLVNGYKFLGVELYTEGKLEQAIEVWQRAARIAPDSADIVSFIRRTQAEIARLEELSNGNK